jgi:hypothetical protein
MKIELNDDELMTIASGLFALAMSEPGKAVESSAAKLEIKGRALCAKFLDHPEMKPGAVESAFDMARQEFCGMGDDAEMAAMLDGTKATKGRRK